MKKKTFLKQNYFIIFILLVETSEGDSLLLSVIEAYCITTTNSGTSIAGLNTLIAKARHSMTATGMIHIRGVGVPGIGELAWISRPDVPKSGLRVPGHGNPNLRLLIYITNKNNFFVFNRNYPWW